MRRVVGVTWLFLGILCAIPVRAEDEAVASRLIPFDSLTITNRALAHEVTDHYTLHCDYPAETFKGRIPMFE